MSSHPTPEVPGDVQPDGSETQPSFAKVFRGYDPAEVDSYLARLISRLKLNRARIADSELSGEEGAQVIDSTAADIAELLHAARLAAEKIRARADRQAADDLTAAEVQARQVRADAEADAYAMRKSAWDMAVEALESLEKQAAEMEAEADRKALAIIGESERTAHRNLASARREGERVMQEAGAQAERMIMRAREESEELVGESERRVEVIKKQIRLESKRRDALAAEVKELRAKLEGPSPAESATSVRLVAGAPHAGERARSAPEEPPVGEDGPADVRPPPEAPAVDGQDMAEEVARLREMAEANGEREPAVPTPRTRSKPAPAPGPSRAAAERAKVAPEKRRSREKPSLSPAPPPSPPAPPEERPVIPSASPVSERELAKMWSTGKPASRTYDAAAADSFGSLFEDLRRLHDTEARSDEGSAEAKPPPPPPVRGAVDTMPAASASAPVPAPPSAPAERISAMERYHRALLPIANRTLRNVKRHLIDIHNEQLEALKNDPADWQPQRERVEEGLAHDLTIMHREAFAAGYDAALEMSESPSSPLRPEAPAGEPEFFVSALFDELVLTVQAGRENGRGARQLGTALSQVYRVWRTDQAERRVRFLAGRSYHRGVLAGFRSAGVDRFRLETGDLCRGCVYDAGDARLVEKAEPFPDHQECRCTIVPA